MATSAWIGRERSWLSEQVVAGLMRISDCVVVAVAGGLAYLHDPVSMSRSAAPLLLIIAVLLMPQAAALFRVYRSSPRPDPTDPLRVSGAWGCVAGVFALAHLLSTLGEPGTHQWVAAWFPSVSNRGVEG